MNPVERRSSFWKGLQEPLAVVVLWLTALAVPVGVSAYLASDIKSDIREYSQELKSHKSSADEAMHTLLLTVNEFYRDDREKDFSFEGQFAGICRRAESKIGEGDPSPSTCTLNLHHNCILQCGCEHAAAAPAEPWIVSGGRR